MDIPDRVATGRGLGNPDDPKSWKGPWKTITKPEEITQLVTALNAQQYHQAHATPFGSGPLADTIGRTGHTPEARALLSGNPPAHLFNALLPKMVQILQTIGTPYLSLQHRMSIITDKEFICTYKLVKESTSSSPSGYHIGHYKAILKDLVLVSMHATMMSDHFK